MDGDRDVVLTRHVVAPIQGQIIAYADHPTVRVLGECGRCEAPAMERALRGERLFVWLAVVSADGHESVTHRLGEGRFCRKEVNLQLDSVGLRIVVPIQCDRNSEDLDRYQRWALARVGAGAGTGAS